MTEIEKRKANATKIVIAYPFAVFALATLLNLFALGVDKLETGIPTIEIAYALAVAGFLMAVNHTWLMTATELTRIKYGMYATPEEWKASGTSWKDIPEVAIRELERTHNAHRNNTENTVFFLLLLVPFSLVSPPSITAHVWIVGFPVARLGYTYSYLYGKDNTRGLFMSLGLLAIYGLASYFLLSVFSH